MKISEITPEMLEVLGNWRDDAAAISCRNLDKVEDALLDEEGSVTAECKLALIREVRLLKKELLVFTKKGGE